MKHSNLIYTFQSNPKAIQWLLSIEALQTNQIPKTQFNIRKYSKADIIWYLNKKKNILRKNAQQYFSEMTENANSILG